MTYLHPWLKKQLTIGRQLYAIAITDSMIGHWEPVGNAPPRNFLCVEDFESDLKLLLLSSSLNLREDEDLELWHVRT